MNIPSKYPNKNFIVCASGPSLTQEIADIINRHKNDYIVVGVNDTYKIINVLDEHYAADDRWWEYWGDDFRKKYPNLSSWSSSKIGQKYNCNLIEVKEFYGLSLTNQYIHSGQNSGFQALNLSYLMGAKKIILVGYDMRPNYGKTHFFGSHPPELEVKSPYDIFCLNFYKIQPEIKKIIFNSSKNSSLKCFEYIDLKELLINNT